MSRATWALLGAGLIALVTGALAAGVQANDVERLDRIVRLGEDWPDRALAELDALPAIGDAAERRARALARAEVAARSLDANAARVAQAQAVVAAREIDAALADGDGRYLEALRLEREGSATAVTPARAALAAYESHCASRQPPRADCEYRTRWRMQQLLSAVSRRQRALGTSAEQAEAALTLAQAGADAGRQALTEAAIADTAAEEGETAQAELHLERARRHAQRSGEPWALGRIALTEGNVAVGRHDYPAAREAMARALAAARRGGHARLEASVLVNSSNLAIKSEQPAEALRAAEQGLPIVRRLLDKRVERVLMHNAVLARARLGHISEAWRDFDLLQAAWAAEGNTGLQVSAMREFGDALADAGDLKGALDVHHRERTLTTQLMTTNRDAALAELRQRYGQEAQQRDIVLLERDNAVKAAELANQALTRRLWALAGGALLLTLAAVLLLARRVRDTNRALQDRERRLRVQTERDALTGLANRRHFHELLHRDDMGRNFRGALLMVDIDHFKRINDDHGHGAGDQVLVEVARRVAATVRAEDVVARWGGEEFLILAPRSAPDDIEALARRLLQAVAGQPVRLASGWPLQVTVSIGHGAFPLPPNAVPLTPEQAINLADMALYTAKSQGRNRAVGILGASADDERALKGLEADFERAWAEGRVDLRVDPGPPVTDP
ncbi:MAG: GGDEF domain-containing protein [Burkholderiales bacterium]|nr:GGDEF domain-containing protein [Burkholderiales bacterium]